VHHTQHDVFESIPQDELAHSARVVAVCAFGFANLEAMLDRTDSKPLERRRLGVQLASDASLQRVMDDGRAKKAGWLENDRIVSVDGTPVATQKEVLERLSMGGSVKVFRLMRGSETIESTIDYSDEPAEKERAARAERRAAFLTAHEKNG
jgi:predicted metalloprotease with PDZ domain